MNKRQDKTKGCLYTNIGGVIPVSRMECDGFARLMRTHSDRWAFMCVYACVCLPNKSTLNAFIHPMSTVVVISSSMRYVILFISYVLLFTSHSFSLSVDFLFYWYMWECMLSLYLSIYLSQSLSYTVKSFSIHTNSVLTPNKNGQHTVMCHWKIKTFPCNFCTL